MREKKQKHLNGPPPKFVSRLHSQLSDKKGCIAAVESETGAYVLGDTLLETVKKARSAFPNEICPKYVSNFLKKHKYVIKIKNEK